MLPTFEPKKMEQLSFNVEFQKGKLFTILLPRDREDLVDAFTVGDVIKNVEFVSSSVIFQEDSSVENKRVIQKGAHQGQYFVILKVLDT